MEPHAEACGELGFEAGVVPLGGRDVGLVDRSAIEGEPSAVPGRLEGLDLVADRDVGVQIGVARPGIAVRERRGHQAMGGDLAGAATSDPSEGGLPFEPPKRVGDRGVVRLAHLVGDRRWRERPEHRDRFHRRERQVIAGDRGRGLPGGPRHEPGQLPGVLRRSTVLLGEHAVAHVGTDPGPCISRHRGMGVQPPGRVVRRHCLGQLHPVRRRGIGGGKRAAEGLPVAGVPPLAEQKLHLLLGHHITGGNAQASQSGPEPRSRRLPLLGVVLRQARGTDLGRVQRGDLAGQVGVAAASAQLVKGHHTTYRQLVSPGMDRCPVMRAMGVSGRSCSGKLVARVLRVASMHPGASRHGGLSVARLAKWGSTGATSSWRSCWSDAKV